MCGAKYRFLRYFGDTKKSYNLAIIFIIIKIIIKIIKIIIKIIKIIIFIGEKMTHRTSVYSDIDLELSKQTDGDFTKDTEINAVINSLQNIISTLQGSRRMLPEFAMDIQNLLFEPLDERTAKMIGNRIVLAIETWDTRVEIVELNIVTNFDQNLYEMTLNFLIRPIEEVRTIEFVLIAQ